jgi:hypothetical protein
MMYAILQEAAHVHETAMQQADASTAEPNSQLESLQDAFQAAKQEGARISEELQALQESTEQSQVGRKSTFEVKSIAKRVDLVADGSV